MRHLGIVLWLATAGCVDLARPGMRGPQVLDGAGGGGAGGRQDASEARPPEVGGVGGTGGVDAGPVEDGPEELPPEIDSAPYPDVVVPDLPPEEVPPGKLALGSPCATGEQCASTHCVAGACCVSACSAEASVCGRLGGCDGSGACRVRAAGTTCAATTCSSAAETLSTCNGAGACLAGAPRSCGSYQCGGGGCLTSCTTTSQCRSPLICNGTACVTPPPPDAGPPDTGLPGLLVDDFQDADTGHNVIGGVITSDNQTRTQVNGQQRFVWNGSSSFQDYIQTFRSNWCDYDLSAYTKLTFRMRASAANKRVAVVLLIGTGACSLLNENRLTTITVGTTETVHTIDLAVTRNRVMALELQPQSLDATEYFLDDIRLLP